jgi:hypothetical protein
LRRGELSILSPLKLLTCRSKACKSTSTRPTASAGLGYALMR